MRSGRMPTRETLTYEGTFNEHVYYIGPREEERILTACPFPMVHNGQPWIAVFLKSMLDGKPRGPEPLDLSIVIDISGSMQSRMDQGDAGHMNRLDCAKVGTEWIINEVCRPDDAVAVSTFNQSGHIIQPLTRLDKMDCEDFLVPVQSLSTSGGTRLDAGMQIGREQLGAIDEGAPRRHKRILFLTDMGEMAPALLESLIKQNAEEGVYVSICAMGAEFNAALTETVTKNKGSNYFCVTNLSEMRECLVDDFHYNMIPGAFDINVFLHSGFLEVAGVYGTPFDTYDAADLIQRWSPERHSVYGANTRFAAQQLLFYSTSRKQALPVDVLGKIVDYLDPPQQSITEINTMFPSRVERNGAMKGGLILMKLNRLGDIARPAPFQLSVEYTDAATGECHSHSCSSVLRFDTGSDISVPEDPLCELALHKGLLLQRYAEVCREQMDGQAPKHENLHGLQQELESFKCSVQEHFGEDAKMQVVVNNFEAFVKLFKTNLETEAANEKLTS